MNTTPPQYLGCIKYATAIVGNKWTALIVRELSSGPKHFCELERALELNPRTLTQRLEQLAHEKIIIQSAETTSKRQAYQLTDKGHALLPVLRAMAEWSAAYPS